VLAHSPALPPPPPLRPPDQIAHVHCQICNSLSHTPFATSFHFSPRTSSQTLSAHPVSSPISPTLIQPDTQNLFCSSSLSMTLPIHPNNPLLNLPAPCTLRAHLGQQKYTCPRAFMVVWYASRWRMQRLQQACGHSLN